MKLTASILSVALLGASICAYESGILRQAGAQDAPPPPSFDPDNAPRGEVPPPVPDEEIEVMTRGPVHEAFATPVIFNPKPGQKVPEAPPAPIDEQPPVSRPVGDNVTWIPGYWNWDDERDRFIWITGIWRAIPPDLEWVPGYWFDDKAGNYQWVAGFWKKDSDDDIVYLPPPPEQRDEGPIGVAPQDNQTWVPGAWVWRQDQYAWRPGYWLDAQPGWMWVPPCYNWTPSGYIFVRGYWDYPVYNRGLMFAPIYPVRRGPFNWSYTPSVVINTGVFGTHLFINSGYNRYYYGDYYGGGYRNRGFTPWFAFNSTRRGYDPIYSHSHWQHRNDRDWDRNLRRDFDRFDNDDNVNDRPGRRFTGTDIGLAAGGGALGGAVLATTLQRMSSNRDRDRNPNSLQLQNVSNDRRDFFRSHSRDLQKMQAQRVEVERTGRPQLAVTPTPGQPNPNPDVKATPAVTEPRTVKLPKSPITAKKVEENAQRFGPNPAGSGRGRDNNPLVNPGATSKPFEAGKPVIPNTTAQPNQPQVQPQTPTQRPDRGFNPKLDPITKAPRNPQPQVQPNVPQPQVQPTVPQPKVQPQVQPTVPQPKPVVPNPVVPQPPKVQPQPQPVIPAAPKVQPQPQPRPQPVIPAAPKVQPQPQPQPRPQPVIPAAPKVQPQPQPRPQPVVPAAPKVQPQPQPKPQPAPQPKLQPQKVPGKNKN